MKTKHEQHLEYEQALKAFKKQNKRIKKLGWYFNKFRFNDKLDDVTWEDSKTQRGIVKANERKA